MPELEGQGVASRGLVLVVTGKVDNACLTHYPQPRFTMTFDLPFSSWRN